MRVIALLSCWSLGVLFGQGCDSDSGTPAPSPQECSDACARVAAADCGDIGQECFDSCVNQGKTDHGIEGCPSEVAAYEACFWATGYYTCDDAGKTQPAACEDESAAVLACADGDAHAGGAGGVSNSGGAPGAGASGEASANGGEANASGGVGGSG